MSSNQLNPEYQEQIVTEIKGYLHNQEMRDYSYSCDKQELLVVTTYNLKPYKDGDQWCVLLGDNIQTGICGFGNSPIDAIRNFNTEFYGIK